MDDIVLTDYHVMRVYDINNQYKMRISYAMKAEVVQTELLGNSVANPELTKFENIQPELLDETWIYVFNDGVFILLDKYEQGVVDSVKLLTPMGVTDKLEQLQPFFDCIQKETDKHLDAIEKLFSSTLEQQKR